MNPRARITFIVLSLLSSKTSAQNELCQSYLAKFPALSATFSVGEGMRFKNKGDYNYRKDGTSEVFTLKKSADAAKPARIPEPWPMRENSIPSIQRLEIKKSAAGKLEEITDGRVHMSFQYDESDRCMPDAVFASTDGKKETAVLMASSQVCKTLSNYLRNNPGQAPCVQGEVSVIDATLEKHEGIVRAFLNQNPRLKDCMNDTKSSGFPLLQLIQKSAIPFASVDGISVNDNPATMTLTQSLEGAHALWQSCKRYALADFIDEGELNNGRSPRQKPSSGDSPAGRPKRSGSGSR